ncbi:MAG TPA: hypothetical protein PL009_02570 [Flavipsychrobacter sp.]|nr:hypothetical protein [Flavipsychrobacter sp.]
MVTACKKVLLILSLFIGTFKLSAQPREFKLKQLTGFYLDDKIPLEKGLNFKVITNRRDFIKHFGLINKPDTPNLRFNHVIVLALQPTKEQWFLSFEETAIRAGNYIEVYCSIKYDKHKITYLDRPIATAAIPKYFSVKTVNFYDKETKKQLASVQIR